MRERLVVGNWKMNPPTIDEALRLAASVASIPRDGVTIGVAPPAVALAEVAHALGESDVRVYAQDVHWEESGAYTGQIAARMLVGLAHGAIVGHSEVRRDQCDDDERVGRKLARALAHGLHAVLCVGESADEFAAGRSATVIARQVRAAIDIARDRMRQGALAIAYEPVWAIGTGRPATGEHASAGARTIRAELGRLGDGIPVLYGGSVSAKTVGEFARADGIEGALVGGASLDPGVFAEIVRAFA